MYGTMSLKLDFPLKTGYIGSLQFGCYYLQHVPASKPFAHAGFEVPRSHNTVLYLIR